MRCDDRVAASAQRAHHEPVRGAGAVREFSVCDGEIVPFGTIRNHPFLKKFPGAGRMFQLPPFSCSRSTLGRESRRAM